MSMSVTEVRCWLSHAPENCVVAIDDGGLSLCVVEQNGKVRSSLDIGGLSLYECQNCDWRGTEGELKEIKDLRQRVSPGEEMPAGECPRCAALCHETGVRV